MSKYIAGKWKFKSILNTNGLSFDNTNNEYSVNFSLITANGTSTTDYSYIIVTYIPAESSPTGAEIKHLYFYTGVSGDSYYSVYDFIANEYFSDIFYLDAIIDFGKSLQTIDDGLYEWITTNLDQEEINIEMTSPNGVELATEQKYCKVNIVITPKLQEKTVTENGEVITDDGYVALKKVVVNVPTEETEEKTIELTSSGSTEITPESGKLLSKVIVTPVLQEKTVIPVDGTHINVLPDEGYAGLEKVIVTPAVTEVSSATVLSGMLTSDNIGRVFRFTGTTDETYTNGDLYEVTDGTISFTIDETTCTADDGMTFYAWANSDYPAQSGLSVSCESLTGNVKIVYSSKYLYPSDSTTMINGSDIITSGGSYRWIAG